MERGTVRVNYLRLPRAQHNVASHGPCLLETALFKMLLLNAEFGLRWYIHTCIHTLNLDTVKTSVKKAGVYVCRVGVREGQLAIYLICSINKRSNGFDVRWKAIPQMCPTVAETTFQKISTGLRQSQFVFTVSKSIVSAEGFK